MTKSTLDRITHYIPPAKIEPLVQEFVEPNPSDHFIYWLFRYRCVVCKQRGEEINEIIPRARSKSAIMDWKNRVLLCRKCHSAFHLMGVTNSKISIMQAKRKEYLISVGREEYL